MKTYSGFNADTAQNLLLDSGAYFVNFDIMEDTPEGASAKLLGATSGGGKFEAKPDIRSVKVDGVKGDAKGLQILDSWSVTMSANLLEFKADTFKYALAAAKTSASTVGTKNYTKIEAKNQIEDTDYLDNITWVGALSGSNEPVIIQVFNALNTEGLSINPKDSDDIVAELQFKGHYDPSSLDNPPFCVYYPSRTTTEETTGA